MIDLFRKSLTNVLGTPRREYSCTRSYHYNRNMCIRNGFFNQDTGTHEFIAKFWNVTEKEWWIFLNYIYIYTVYILSLPLPHHLLGQGECPLHYLTYQEDEKLFFSIWTFCCCKYPLKHFFVLHENMMHKTMVDHMVKGIK